MSSGFAEIVPSLGVADDHVGHADLGQHQRADFPRVGPSLLPEDILGPQGDGDLVGVEQGLD
jgi:hypothetical protein